MTPAQLQPAQFEAYPPEAREVALKHIQLLRHLPVCFLSLLMREVIAYDYKFPVERKELDQQFTYLESMTPEQLARTMLPFAHLRISPEVERLDWITSPARFSEQLSAHLWNTHQIDAFRTAAVEYVDKMNASQPAGALAVHRLGIVLIGDGASRSDYAPFRKLLPRGVHYKAVNDRDGYATILSAVSARAAKYPAPFAHWRIEGGALDSPPTPGLTCISYASLLPVRALLQAQIQKGFESSMGPEALRTALAALRPKDVGLRGSGPAAVLDHFQLSLLTEGSGTQIFSTTFVQWSAREALRRAQPLTLLARFTPRQQGRSSQEMLSDTRHPPVLDPEGSFVDADMGAYYTWINQQRLTGASQATFLVWFENRGEALAIAPNLHKGTESTAPVTLESLVATLA
jgi:hypothetical protein